MANRVDPKLSEADVRAWVGDASFQRSRPYLRASFSTLRRQGDTLKAFCQGSAGHPYRVEATLGPRGISSASCSCPVGDGGHCKHVAALLLIWMQNPASFVEVEALDATLEQRSKPELITLIHMMLDRYPDLETLLELPLPGSDSARGPLDPQIMRRQVQNAFAGAGDEWDAAASAASSLQPLLTLGESYVNQGDWSHACILYQTLLEETLAHYDELPDEEGDLGLVIGDCANKLGECLDASSDPTQRATILRFLFDIYLRDIEHGGIGLGDEAYSILTDLSTAEERRTIAAWVRTALPAGSAWHDSWRRQSLGSFLLRLERDTMDDETFLRICRETGRLNDLVQRLLERKRIDEAYAAARQAEDFTLLELADRFQSRGHVDLALGLVRERAKTSKDRRLNSWLKERAVERGDMAEVLVYTEQAFAEIPSLQNYNAIKAVAQGLGRWDKLRAEIIARLTKQRQFDLLLQIYLEENDIDAAFGAFEKSSYSRYIGGEITLRLARAAEAVRPRDALQLYSETVKALIRNQGRENYVSAARVLLRMREVYRHLNEEPVWLRLIADMRQDHKRLRAFQEELTKAGL